LEHVTAVLTETPVTTSQLKAAQAEFATGYSHPGALDGELIRRVFVDGGLIKRESLERWLNLIEKKYNVTKEAAEHLGAEALKLAIAGLNRPGECLTVSFQLDGAFDALFGPEHSITSGVHFAPLIRHTTELNSADHYDRESFENRVILTLRLLETLRLEPDPEMYKSPQPDESTPPKMSCHFVALPAPTAAA
jgi:hypothetical protein